MIKWLNILLGLSGLALWGIIVNLIGKWINKHIRIAFEYK